MKTIIFKGKKGEFKDLTNFIIESKIQTIDFKLTVIEPDLVQILTIKPVGTEEISKEDSKKIFDFISESNK